MKQKAMNKSPINIEEKVSYLSNPKIYADNLNCVVVKETHMSWVFLAGGFAYKLKKPFKNTYQNLSTIDLRHKQLLSEFNLNKPMAKDIYLEVFPMVLRQDGQIQLYETKVQDYNNAYNPSDVDTVKLNVIDWLIKMKRIPENQMLEYAIKHNHINEEQLLEAAKFLAKFYVQKPAEQILTSDLKNKLENEINQSYDDLTNPDLGLALSKIKETSHLLFKFIQKETELFKQRISMGRIVEAHGDLKPEHIRISPEPAIIDCLEFSRQLRVMDIAEELSYLYMECEIMGYKKAGQVFIDVYQKQTNDIIPERLLCFYKSKKAFLRAYLVGRHCLEARYQNNPEWMRKAKIYLDLAERYSHCLND